MATDGLRREAICPSSASKTKLQPRAELCSPETSDVIAARNLWTTQAARLFHTQAAVNDPPDCIYYPCIREEYVNSISALRTALVTASFFGPWVLICLAAKRILPLFPWANARRWINSKILRYAHRTQMLCSNQTTRKCFTFNCH